MPVAPKANPLVREFVYELIDQGKVRLSLEHVVAGFSDLNDEIRPKCFLGIDEAIVETYPDHYLFSLVTIVEDEAYLVKDAVFKAKQAALTLSNPEMVSLADDILNKLTEYKPPLKVVKNVETEGDAIEVLRPKLLMGDFCTWTSFNHVMRGKVDVIHVSGTVKAHDNAPGIIASASNPIATIRVYDKDGNGFAPSDRRICRPVSTLTKIGALLRPRAAKYLKFATKGKRGEIMLYGDIGDSMWGGISAAEFRKQLNELGKVDELDIRINSGGGDVFEGAAIYNALREHKSHKVVHIDGLAASIATIIACAGDVIHMAETAQYMIHRGWTIAMGNKNELEKMIVRLEATDQMMANVYAGRTSQDLDDILQWMDSETWFGSTEAKEYGFVDQVVNETAIAARTHDIAPRSWFKKGPSVEDLDAVEATQRRQLARGRHHAASR